LHFGDQGAAFFREYLRCIFQLGAITPRLGDTLLERRDLRAGALLTLDPTILVRGELRQPAVGEFGFARDCLLLGLNFSELGALAGNNVVHLRELRFQIGSGGKCAERRLSFSF